MDDFDGDTCRTVYTVKLADVVYVLHAFQKKARHGIETPKHEIDRVRERYRRAVELHGRRPGPRKETKR